MIFTWNKLGACVAGLAVLSSASMIAEQALANSTNFSWTMLRRGVHGANNQKLHLLDAGTLTVSGTLWIHEKRAKATSQPMAVTIYVRKRGSIFDDDICNFDVIPSTLLNDRRAFSNACGTVAAGTYYLFAAKPKSADEDGDGWHNQAAGMLTTR